MFHFCLLLVIAQLSIAFQDSYVSSNHAIALPHLTKVIKERNLPMNPLKATPLISYVMPSKIHDNLHKKHLYQQTYEDTSIPVLFGYYHVVHNVDTNEITTVDNLRNVAHGVSTEPIQSIAAAKDAALNAWCPDRTCPYTNMQVSLCMWPNPTVVCYNVTFVPTERFFGNTMTYIVNGNTLEILAEIDGRHRFSGNGNSMYNGAVTFTVNLYSSSYYLEDVGRAIATVDCQFTNCSTITRLSNTRSTWTTYNNSLQVHYSAEKAYDYFLQTFSRSGIDGHNGPQVYTSVDGRDKLFPHMTDYETGFNDAIYSSEGIVYGTGDGINFTQLVSLDYVGHEYMHGIISYVVGPNLGFVYANESGALEEAYCDVFGAMVERFALGGTSNRTWMIGEDFYTPGVSGDAWRYLDNPHKAADMGYTTDDNPDYFTQMYTGTLDNGGVHVNCGIPSKVFYLLAMGGQHELGGPNMTGIGPDQAAKIWWQALTVYLTPSAQFSDARMAQMYAARDLYGAESFQLVEVETAWSVCGVGSLPAPYVTSSPISNPQLESSSSPWTFSGSCSTYVVDGLYAHSGKGYAQLGSINSASGSLIQSPITFSTHAVSANLTLWLYIVSSDPSYYSDSIDVYIKNVNTGVETLIDQYFNGQTTGTYVMKGPYNLMSYAGIPFTVEFDVQTSSSYPTTFYIDDVYVTVAEY